jgi:hypothetical protein
LTFQEGDTNSYPGTRDTYISSGSQDSNFGTSSSLSVDSSPTDRGLVKFLDIIGFENYRVPINATISAANITMEVYEAGNDFSIYEILENWTEGDATYNNRLSGISWGSIGCADSPSRSTTAEATGVSGAVGTVTFDITNAMQRWVNETSTNYGVVLHPGGSNGLDLRSSEYSNQSQRPLLTVNYNSSDCTNIKVYVRTSNDKSTWTSWQEVNSGDSINDSNIASRYLEYRVEMGTSNVSIKPYLEEITMNYTAVVTNASGGYSYNFSSPSTFGDYLIVAETWSRTMYANATVILELQFGVDPEVELISPNDGQWFNYSNLTLIYNASDVNNDMVNASLFINGQRNMTNNTPILNGQYNNFSINFTSGQYNWTVEVRDSNNNPGNDSERTFYIDLEDPNVTLIFPSDGGNYAESELNLSFNVTDNMDDILSCDVVLDNN